MELLKSLTMVKFLQIRIINEWSTRYIAVFHTWKKL